MNCVICGAITLPRLVKTDIVVHGRRVWLADIPADVCCGCGEPYFEMANYDQMEREAREQITR